MNISDLTRHATDKTRSQTVRDYVEFCAQFLECTETQLQARIVSQNEQHYEFFQYRAEGHFNITRPLNSRLMYRAESFSDAANQFHQTLEQLREAYRPSEDLPANMVRTIYTLQQSIGAALDALPAGKSNQARKANGDLFERLIRLIVTSLDVDCVAGTVQVPMMDEEGVEFFKSSYQHDLLFSRDQELKIIGSVKTSSKDRIDKVFMDKFLYCRLTETALPHVAIFLNDIQRKAAKRQDEYGVSATFLPGHFKAYTIKLNPLDGVYYCDIRPNMVGDELLSRHINTIDHFFFTDLWNMLARKRPEFGEIVVKADDERQER